MDPELTVGAMALREDEGEEEKEEEGGWRRRVWAGNLLVVLAASVALPLALAIESRLLRVATPLGAGLGSNVARGGGSWEGLSGAGPKAAGEPAPAFDVAVVLGYALQRDGEPTKVLRERIKAGVALHQSGAARALIFSGGHPGGGRRGNRSEAEVMATWGKTLLPEQDAGHDSVGGWHLEEDSTSTRENALFSLRMAREDVAIAARRGVGRAAGAPRRLRVAIVTSSFHQLRSKRVFEAAWEDLRREWEERAGAPGAMSAEAEEGRLLGGARSFGGADFTVVPVDEDLQCTVKDKYHRTTNILREVAAIAYYKAKGWL